MAYVAIDEEFVFSQFVKSYDIKGKKILEIGGSIPEHLVSQVEEWVSVDPFNENTVSNQYTYIKGRAQDIPYQDEYFDFIFSSNCFHHIANFGEALEEMYRVLKPAGIVYSAFGPIWSAPDGCHLENIPFNNQVINFWEEKIVPNWFHLVYSYKELNTILQSALSKEKAFAVADYIYFSNWINRMSIFDYESALKNSLFEIIEFTGTDEFGYVPKIPDYDNPFIGKLNTWENDELSKNIDKYSIRDLNIILKK